MPGRSPSPARRSSALRAGLRLPLWLLPRRFRRAYGVEMLELFELRCREEWERGGTIAATRLFGRNFVDLLMTALAEHRQSSFSADGAYGPPPRLPAPRKGDSLVLAFLDDLKYSLRAFRRQPAFFAVIVFTLALGIGANTAIFSVVNAVLLSPLPFHESDRLMDVWGRFDPESGFDYPIFPLSPPEWIDYRAQSRALEDVASYTTSSATLTGGDAEPQRITTMPASHNLFAVLGEEPVIGRTFTVAEDLRDDQVVVLEHGFWRTRFGGREELVGETIQLNDEPWIVLGVMPEGFSFGADAKIWLPIGINPDDPLNRRSHFIRAVGRLAPDATLEQAEAEMETLMAAWKEEFPDIHTGHYLFLSPMIEDVVGSVRPALLLLLAASGLVLLVVCANVASVLLARGEERLREIAVRGAMGAGRAQIIRLLLAESLALSAVGGVVGVALAFVGVRALVAAAGSSIPRADAVTVDATVLGFAALVSALAAVMFGLFPALHSATIDMLSNLKEGVGSVSPSRARLWFRRGLVVAEVALCFVLLLNAGLVLRSVDAVLTEDGGFRPDGVVVANLSLPRARYASGTAVRGFYHELLDRVRAVGGVTVASASSNVPLGGAVSSWDFRVEGEAEPGPGEQAWGAEFHTALPGFFEAMGVGLVRGRVFEPGDDEAGELVTVINQAMADTFFAGEDPLGRRIMICCPDEGQEAPWMTIVGVVDNVRYRGLSVASRPAYFAPHDQVERASYGSAFPSLAVVVRTTSDPAAAASALRSLVRELDPNLPLVGLRTMDDVVAASVARPRFVSRLMGLFAVISLALGATGIYGVLAFMVAQRGREIGIRRALGAASGELAGLVVVQGMGLVAAGLVLGATASIWTTSVLGSLLYGVSPTDPATYVVVTLALALVAVLACAVPTLRAVRVDPLVALRAD